MIPKNKCPELDEKHPVRDFLISIEGGTELDLLMGENLRTLGRDLANPEAQISQVMHRDQLRISQGSVIYYQRPYIYIDPRRGPPVRLASMEADCSQSCSTHAEKIRQYTQCKQDPIYIFPEMKLCGLVPRFHIHVSALQRKFRLYIPFLGIARPQPQFPNSCVCERFIYFQDRSTYFLQQERQTHRGNI